jgi:hypothetical protein
MLLRQFPSLRSTSRVRAARWFATVLLGLQALLWGGGSVIEAKAAAESLQRFSHVEDQGTTTCPPIHSHLDCVICRTLNGSAPASPATALFGDAYLEVTSAAADDIRPAERGLPGTLGSRGPPGA